MRALAPDAVVEFEVAEDGRAMLFLLDVPGIGAATEARIQAWLTSGSPTANQGSSKPPSYQGPGSGGAPGDLHSPHPRRTQP